jgi:hypothetical protein
LGDLAQGLSVPLVFLKIKTTFVLKIHWIQPTSCLDHHHASANRFAEEATSRTPEQVQRKLNNIDRLNNGKARSRSNECYRSFNYRDRIVNFCVSKYLARTVELSSRE